MATPDPAAMNAAFAAAVAARQQADADRARVAAMTAAYAAAVQAAAAQRAATQAAADAVAKYGAYARAVEQADDRLRRLSRAAGDGTFQRQATAVTALNRQYDLLSSKLANQQRAADLASGAFQRHAAAVAAVNRESAALAQQEATAQMVAERGRFGAFREQARPHLQTLGGLAAAGVAVPMGMMRSGFGGTAEWAAFSYQWERLNRQLAAIAIPVFERIGSVVGRVAAYFESLSGAEQDQIMRVGVVAAGLVTFAGVLKVASIAAGAFAGTVRTAATVAGLGSLAGAGGVGTAVATAAAGGGLLGRFGTAAAGLAPGAALGAIGAATGYGPEVLGATALYGGARGVMAGRGLLAGAARTVAPVAAGMAVYEGATGGHYERLRGKGMSRFEAGLGALGGGLADVLTFGGFSDYWKRKGEMPDPVKEAEKKRRDVTPMGTAIMEAGDTAQLIQEKLLEATIRREGEDVAFRETLLGLMHRIVREAEERGDAVPASILEVMRRARE